MNYTQHMASSPTTPVHDLYQMAQTRPDLHSALLLNPALPPDIRQWLSQPRPAQGQPTQPLPQGVPPQPYGTQPLPQSRQPLPTGYGQNIPGSPTPPSVQQQPMGQPPMGQPPYQPPGYPPMAGVPAPLPQPPHSAKGKLIGIIAAVVVLVMVIVGTSFFIFGSPGAYAGAKTPQQLQDDLKDALNSQDFLTPVTMTAPSELHMQEQWQAAIETMLNSIGDNDDNYKSAFSPETYASLLNAMEIDTSGMKYSTNELSDTIAETLISGKITISVKDKETFRENVHELFQSFGVDEKDLGDKNLDQTIDELINNINDNPTHELADDALPVLMQVKENDRWFISPTMTLAELTIIKGGVTYRQEQRERKGVDYGAHWYAPKKTAGSAEEALKGFAQQVSSILEPKDLIDEDLMKYFSTPERRIFMIYGASLKDEDTENVNLTLEVEKTSSTTNSMGTVTPFDGLSLSIESAQGDTASISFNGSQLELSLPNYEDYSLDYGRYFRDTRQVGIVWSHEDHGWTMSLPLSLMNLVSQIDIETWSAKAPEHFRKEIEAMAKEFPSINDAYSTKIALAYTAIAKDLMEQVTEFQEGYDDYSNDDYYDDDWDSWDDTDQWDDYDDYYDSEETG
ncbi:MAG: hypothetical protein Q4P66_04075 [Actinomycetaceae bacterium]|nr:hypothetical protein [Actinomycetaceae bacterium]